MNFGFLPSAAMLALAPEILCEKLSNLGYRAVEWPLNWTHPQRTQCAFRRRIMRAAKNCGLEVNAAVIQLDPMHVDLSDCDKVTHELGRCLETLCDMGIPNANLFSGPAPWNNPVVIGRDLSEGGAWSRLMRSFDALIPLAERLGIRIAVENVWGMLCHDYYSLALLIHHYNHPVLGVNLDISHDQLYGHDDSSWIVQFWNDKIFNVHLKDACGIPTPGKFVFPLLGDGLINWSAFFNAISLTGYKGPLTIEFEADAYLRHVLNGDIWKAAQFSIENARTLSCNAERPT